MDSFEIKIDFLNIDFFLNQSQELILNRFFLETILGTSHWLNGSLSLIQIVGSSSSFFFFLFSIVEFISG